MALPFPVKLLWYISRVAYVIVTNFMAIPAYITWFFLLYPLRKMNPYLFWKIETVLFKGLLAFITIWLYSGGYKIIESGDNIDTIMDEMSILLVNHQSTADVPIVMTSMHPKGLLTGKMMWIMDFIFKFTNFGWISCCHGDFFIQQRAAKEEQLGLLEKHLKQVFVKSFQKWLVLFPEGGFLRKRRKRSQDYARKNNLPILQHVALPRLGALQTLTDTLNQQTNGKKPDTQVKWIIDMTLGYPGGEALDMHGMCVGWWEPRNFSVHYRVYHIDDVPIADTDNFTKWLYDRYQEKDDMLKDYHSNKKTLDETDTEARRLPRMKRKLLEMDTLGHIFYHVFYAASTYLFCTYLYSPILSVMGSFISIFV